MAAEAVAEPVVPRNGNLLGEMDRAAAAGGVPTPKKLAADGQAGFDTDYAEMARQQAAKWATMDHTEEGREPPEIVCEGEEGSPGAVSRRYARSMARPEPRPSTDYDPVEGHSAHPVFGTAGRFNGPKDKQGEKSQESRTLGASVSSIQKVSGVDAWLSKRGPPSSSPVPEEEPEPEVSSRRISRGLTSTRKERYNPAPMDRHPVEKKVYAATFDTVPRGDLFAQEKHARHGSVHQRSHADEFHATYKPDRPGPAWSNVRWSAETSQMLEHGQHGRTQQRDLYGQTEEDKEAQRRRVEQAQRQYEEQQRVHNTPRWETDKKWKTGIRPVPEPEQPEPPRQAPTVQLDPRMAFGKQQPGQSSPFLSKPREDLYHHHTSGSPRPGQLHTSDANHTLPRRGDQMDEPAEDNTDSTSSTLHASFKAAVHTVTATKYMLDHQIRPFDDDSQVVQVAKEKWGSALGGREGNKSAKELKKALGYAPKEKGSNREPSGMNASINQTTCKTKRLEEDKKLHAIRWVVDDKDECFDRTSLHHPEHYKRMLHGTSAQSQTRVAGALQHDMNPSRGSVVSKLVNRHGKGARKNKQIGGAQHRWWTRGEGYYDVRKRCGYVPAGFEGAAAEGGRGGADSGTSGHAHAKGAGSSSRPVSSPASASEDTGRRSRRHVYAEDGEDAESDVSWDSGADEAGGQIFMIPEGVGATTRTTRARGHRLHSNPQQSPSCNAVDREVGEDSILAGRESRFGPRHIPPVHSAAFETDHREYSEVGGNPAQSSPGDRTRNWVMSGAEPEELSH